MLIEATIFHEHARDPLKAEREFRVLPVLIFLKGLCPRRGLDMRTPNGLGIGHFPVVWEVENDSALETLRGVETGTVSWGALFWTSLMAGGGTKEVRDLWLRLLDLVVPAEHRADVAYVALEFSELAGHRPEWERLLEGRNVTESTLGNRMIAIGEAKERVRLQRENLLRVVTTLYRDAVPEDYLNLIRTQESYQVLDSWFQAALDAGNVEAFLAVMRQ
jgi:hypothetical protein